MLLPPRHSAGLLDASTMVEVDARDGYSLAGYGLEREAKYREVMGASESTLKTPLTDRQIDILKTKPALRTKSPPQIPVEFEGTK